MAKRLEPLVFSFYEYRRNDVRNDSDEFHEVLQRIHFAIHHAVARAQHRARVTYNSLC